MGVQPLCIEAEFPAKFEPLLGTPHRYKVFYGGRNGAKSWQFARALLIRGLSGKLRVLCTREVQSSLKESVKQLLADQIKLLGLDAYYKVLESEIRGPDGTLFIFKGLSDPEALKSAEGVDIVWIEEARVVSAASWKKLDHTIRKAGAQIWISFNPELETDFLYKLFVKGPPPPDSVVVKVSYRDNQWLDPAIKRQLEHLKATDPDDFLWIYEGFCRVALEGAVYARELRAATKENRITQVPVEKSKPVHTFWDLGRGDMTAIWFVQIVGFQYRVVGFYQNHGFVIDHYLAKLQEEKERRGWFYGTHWLPHDADNKLLGARRTIKQQVQDAGHTVRIVPKIPLADGVNAARTIFAHCWFDQVETEEGVNCLRAYHYEVDDDGSRSKLPEHDWCLAPETELLTRNGSCPIDQLPPSGEVLTACGWKPYHSPRVTRKAAPLVEVRFVGGHSVRCTPDHLFATDKGWKFAQYLTRDMPIQSTLTPSRNISTAVFTGCGRASGICREAVGGYIAMFGSGPLGSFRRVATYTTRIATSLITAWKILSACRPASIFPLPLGDAKFPAPSRTRHAKPQLNGIAQMRASNGTASKHSEVRDGPNGSENPDLAAIVALNSMLSFGRTAALNASAPRLANRLRIASVRPLPEVSDVWCITVPGAEHYSLSNGAIVHNSSHASDGFRYMGVALKDDAPKPKAAPRPQRKVLKGRRAWLGR